MMDVKNYSLNDISSMQSLLEEFGTDGVIKLMMLALVDEGNTVEQKVRAAIDRVHSSARDVRQNPETEIAITKYRTRKLANAEQEIINEKHG